MAKANTARSRAQTKHPDEIPEEHGLVPFLTAYDPADLPGSSIDPLGFTRGVMLFSDKILPGLTNVGHMPRYFSVLCAGVVLGGDARAASPRAERQERLEILLRFERLWVLANLLAAGADADLPAQIGIRGALYARAHLEQLERKGEKRTGTEFKLLIRQVPYGVVGIYGNIATGMKLLDNKTLVPLPDSGERLGQAFLDESGTPRAVLRAVLERDALVPLDLLASWGRTAHATAPTGTIEASVLRDALHQDGTRSRMVHWLSEVPVLEDGDSELKRMARLVDHLDSSPEALDLRESLSAIIAFESCYRRAMLVLERLLWMARESSSQSVSDADVSNDPVIASCSARIADEIEGFERILLTAISPEFLKDLGRLDELRLFLANLGKASQSPLALARCIVDRHGDVQRGKRDRGRPKQPWLEQRMNAFELTIAGAGELDHEPTEPDNVKPHAYRFFAADSLSRAALGGTR